MEKRRAQTLPLRLRLVAGFSFAITVVLIAAGAFVYWRVSVGLDAQLDRDADAVVVACCHERRDRPCRRARTDSCSRSWTCGVG